MELHLNMNFYIVFYSGCLKMVKHSEMQGSTYLDSSGHTLSAFHFSENSGKSRSNLTLFFLLSVITSGFLFLFNGTRC